jgi:hypothetical protein
MESDPEGSKAACQVLNTGGQCCYPAARFHVRVERTSAFVANYIRKITTWLEAPMLGLFFYRKRYFHHREVHDGLGADESLQSKSSKRII